jgi:uncharacterized protein
VKDPRSVVKPGDIVRVKVLEVDKARKRISLTMRLDEAPQPRQAQRGDERRHQPSAARQASAGRGGEAATGALADALRRAGFSRDGKGSGRK